MYIDFTKNLNCTKISLKFTLSKGMHYSCNSLLKKPFTFYTDLKKIYKTKPKQIEASFWCRIVFEWRLKVSCQSSLSVMSGVSGVRSWHSPSSSSLSSVSSPMWAAVTTGTSVLSLTMLSSSDLPRISQYGLMRIR